MSFSGPESVAAEATPPSTASEETATASPGAAIPDNSPELEHFHVPESQRKLVRYIRYEYERLYARLDCIVSDIYGIQHEVYNLQESSIELSKDGADVRTMRLDLTDMHDSITEIGLDVDDIYGAVVDSTRARDRANVYR